MEQRVRALLKCEKPMHIVQGNFKIKIGMHLECCRFEQIFHISYTLHPLPLALIVCCPRVVV
jgi:hypothetical protein